MSTGEEVDGRKGTYRVEQMLKTFETLHTPELAKKYIVERAAREAGGEGRQQ